MPVLYTNIRRQECYAGGDAAETVMVVTAYCYHSVIAPKALRGALCYTSRNSTAADDVRLLSRMARRCY